MKYYYKAIETGVTDKIFRTKKEAFKWFNSFENVTYYDNSCIPSNKHVLKDGTFMSTKGLILIAVYKLEFNKI